MPSSAAATATSPSTGSTENVPPGSLGLCAKGERDVDGITRHVERVGSSGTAAVSRAALRDRQWTPAGGEITADSTIGAVAVVWLRELGESDRAVRTKITYRDLWTRHVEPAVGGICQPV
jgi:hypothetical protein